MPVPGLLHRLERRHDALRALRGFFDDRAFVEAETPVLIPAPTTEPHIDPLAVGVRTDPAARALRRYLRTSPELALKRLLAAGVPRVYEVARVFRDGEQGPLHLPEFTLLEWYRADAGLDALVCDLEELLVALARTLTGGEALWGLGGERVEVSSPFERRSVAELFATHADIDLDLALSEMAAGDAAALVRRTKAAGHVLRPGADFEDAFFHIMGTCIEPRIGHERPTVVERWPRQMAVLARLCRDDPRYAERFELYAGGLELANAFDELIDPVEQRARFLEDNRLRRSLGKEALPLDEVFLEELAGMRPSAGIALGVDRLLMLIFGERDINAVQALPHRMD